MLNGSTDGVSFAMVVAVAENGVIGKDNQLPWRIPSDLKYFKSITMGKPMIMGRKTFESIGKPLPGRETIVVTQNAHFSFPGVLVAHSVGEAMAIAKDVAKKSGASEVMVVGGAQIYAESLLLIDRVYLTEVGAEVEGDAYFPSLGKGWVEESRESFPADESNQFPYSFVVCSRAA